MRKLYYELRQLDGEVLYFAEAIDTKEYKVKVRGKDKYIELDDDIINLPYGFGIFGVYPLDSEGSHPVCQRVQKAQAGADWLYCGSDFDGASFYIKKGKRIFFYNMSCMNEDDKVEVEALYNDDDIDVPKDIAFDIINAVLGVSLKTVGFPIDQTNDKNPNVVEVKRRLAEPDSL